MKEYDLSILIPARNEEFLARTIEDILQNKEGKTEIIVVLDGAWAKPAIPMHPDVTIIYFPKSVGQRAATNQACRLSSAKYVIKTDAHCSFGKGFDVKMMADMQDDWTMVPAMKNLHAFDWVCEACAHRLYQGPTPKECQKCKGSMKREMIWRPRSGVTSTTYRFDNTLHFQYFKELDKRQEGDIIETMGLQGSFFMLTRAKYWELDICDEKHGSWGQQGVEVACKTWLSGGKCMVNKKTWYAHMFRTQGGDFGFPYPLSGSAVEKARAYSRELWFQNKWPKAIHPLSWLVKRFSPVPGWDELKKEIVYYTCNTHKLEIDEACRKQLKKSGLPIVAVSLNKNLDFGNENITIKGERGALMMHRQILAGLQKSKADIVFLCESDVLYHPSHFNFQPARKDVFYYNVNVWRMRYPDGHAVWTDDLQQVSGVCAYRELLVDFYTKRIAQIEKEGFNTHYEPGVKQTIYPRVKGGKYGTENHKSEVPNVCIRHDSNLTKSKWSPDEFRDKRYSKGWTETDDIPGWGKIEDFMK